MEITPETAKQAKEELEAICKKYQISLIPVVIHQGNNTFSSIDIVPARQPAPAAAETAQALE